MTKDKQTSKSVTGIIWLIRLLILAYAIFQAYVWRFYVYFDDSVAYMEMARFLLRGQPEQLINGNWSPLYPVLIAIVFQIFKPALMWQLSWVHGLNILLLVFKYLCFEILLHKIFNLRDSILQKKEINHCSGLPDSWIKVVAIVIFGLTSFSFGGVHQETPDYLVHAFAFLGLSQLIDIKLKEEEEKPTRLNYMVLGLSCGLGYLAKSAFTLIGGLYILIGFFIAKKSRLQKTSIMLGLFLACYAPMAIAVSSKLGYFAATEAGKLSYMQVVTRQYHPTRPMGPELTNTVRVLNKKPLVVEFRTELGETYPPFFERLQWMKGYKIKFSIMDEFVAVVINLVVYLVRFGSCILLASLFWLICFKKHPWKDGYLTSYWLPLSYPIVLLSVFMFITCVIGHYRYIESAVVVLLLTLLVSVNVPPNATRLKAIACALYVLPLAINFIPIQANADLKAFQLLNKPHSYWIALDLKDLGIKPGDRVAQMGYDTRVEKFGSLKLDVVSDYYWAQLADVQIAVDIPELTEFKQLSNDEQRKLLEKLKKYGVKAVVLYRQMKPPDNANDWIKLKRSGNYVYPLFDKVIN